MFGWSKYIGQMFDIGFTDIYPTFISKNWIDELMNVGKYFGNACCTCENIKSYILGYLNYDA